MDDPMTAAHVRTILERPSGHRWVMQDIGLLALWLDGGHEQRLHVWSPAHCVTESPIHDHP